MSTSNHPNVSRADNLDLNLYRRRKFSNYLGLCLSMCSMAIGLIALLWILIVLFKHGFAGLSWAIFTESTPAPGSA
mgnify:FL=1